MTDAALHIFDSLNSYSRLQELIDNGEAEGLHLECKAPSEPRLTRELKAKLAEALSGFANTEGGVIIWGISTTKHSHSNLDVLTQIEPIGNCRRFAQQVDRAIPPSTTPSITTSKTKTIVKSSRDTRGVVLTYIPKTMGDPIQSNIDQKFYFRNGDEFSVLPYQMLQRLFAATKSPDLYPLFDARLVALEKNDLWKIPIIIENRSSAVAEHVTVSVTIENSSACEKVTAKHFRDVSDINPEKLIFINNLSGVIHRGLNVVAGTLHVGMQVQERAKRTLRLGITVYADKMRAHEWHMTVQLAKRGFSVKKTGERDLY